MKMLIRTVAVLSVCSVLILTSSCKTSSRTSVIVSSGTASSLPPGQAKKVYGQQSARDFAPGQQKKKGGTTVIVKN